MDKELRNLIDKKNQYINSGEEEKADEVRQEIKKLKEKLKSRKKDIKTKILKTKTLKTVVTIPSIPDSIIINNIDITDMFYKLKNSIYANEAKKIYTSIINICDSRKNYINTVLKKNINSYEIDIPLELSLKTRRIIESLKSCKSLSKDEIERRISNLVDDIDSYDIDINNLTLKSSLYNELVYINEIKNLAYKLLVGIKRSVDKPKSNNQPENIILTKKQKEIIEGIYIKNIPECNISDYLFGIKYYIEKENVSPDEIAYLVKVFFDRYSNIQNNVHLIEDFKKYIKKVTKSFSKDDKKVINSIITEKNFQISEVSEDDYRFEILLYFIYNGHEKYLEEIIDKMPDIANGYYDGKSIVEKIYQELLNEYNTILQEYYKNNESIIDLMEKVFIKIYSINNSEKEKIELITQEYIQQLKTINSNTVAKNIILFRINNIREQMGITSKIDLPEIQSENYRYLDFYYREEILNSSRKKLENEVLLTGNNTLSYSIIKNNEYIFLRLNVVDLTPYFIEGTDLYQLALKGCVDCDKIRKYTRFDYNMETPSITFEFKFYKSILQNCTIYDSIVKPINDRNLVNSYNELLSCIGIYNAKADFNDLIKVSLKNNEGQIPYIVKYKNEDNNYYRMITDLNHLFGKISKSDVDNIYEIFKNSIENYGLSSDIVGKHFYDINVLNPTCNFYDILMQMIIKSYYRKDVNLTIDKVEQYVKKKKY